MTAELQARISVIETRMETVKELPIQFARIETEVKGLREQQKSYAMETKELLSSLRDNVDILKSEVTKGKGVFIGAMSVSAFFGAIISKLVSVFFK